LEESEALVEQVDGDDTKCRTGCIYLITNLINGKVYVGQTLDYKRRMKKHEKSGKNPKYYFPYAIRKYGWENFTKEILIDDVPEEDLDNLEINYIDFYNSSNREKGYNCTKGGGGISGYKFTEEQRMAQSKRSTKNHSVEGGGCIFFCKTENKWVALGCYVTGRKHIGSYFTKDKAIEALKMYNETGQCMPSDLIRRINGSGSVYYVKQTQKWSAKASGKGSKRGPKPIGVYFTKEKAFAALKLYNETGKCMDSDNIIRKQGTGSIQELISKTKGIRFTAMYRSKYVGVLYVGVFDTYEEADQALKSRILDYFNK
jgi:group I intron endonuclease